MYLVESGVYDFRNLNFINYLDNLTRQIGILIWKYDLEIGTNKILISKFPNPNLNFACRISIPGFQLQIRPSLLPDFLYTKTKKYVQSNSNTRICLEASIQRLITI